VKKMKKMMYAVLIVLVALGMVSGVVSAQSAKSAQKNTGLLHEYMEKALAEKLGIPLATVESQFDAGVTLYQIAIDNGISQDGFPAFMLEVRTSAISAALTDGVITQDQADRMLLAGGHGFGNGMMRGASGTGPCGGTGIPMGMGMQRGGHWQQGNP
jgi:hypothetical protein